MRANPHGGLVSTIDDYLAFAQMMLGGGLGTTWRSDPHEDVITILMTQCAWTSPNPPNICLDFWTTAYRAIDD